MAGVFFHWNTKARSNLGFILLKMLTQGTVKIRLGSYMLKKQIILFINFFIVPERIHHVAYIHTFCISLYENWVLRNLPSKYLLISSTADFVSMWCKIKGVEHQILYFNPHNTGSVKGQWLSTSIIASS